MRWYFFDPLRHAPVPVLTSELGIQEGNNCFQLAYTRKN